MIAVVVAAEGPRAPEVLTAEVVAVVAIIVVVAVAVVEVAIARPISAE
jgi:hypothetical protein